MEMHRCEGHFRGYIGLFLSAYRALLSVYRALLSVYGALSGRELVVEVHRWKCIDVKGTFEGI